MANKIMTSVGELYLSRQQIDATRPTIVFLHDSLGSVELWRDFPQKLGTIAACNILVYDRLGYGRSGPFTTSSRENSYLETEADILMDVLNVCGIDAAILFGHSDGGSIALIAAAKYPSRIMGLITEGAHIFVEDITLNGIREAVKEYQTTHLKEKLRKYHGDKTEAVFLAWTETWLSKAFSSWNIEHFLPQIICPVLIIQGENDEYGSQEQVNQIVRQVTGKAYKYIIPTAGHTPHKEAKEMVLERSSAFIHEVVAKRVI